MFIPRGTALHENLATSYVLVDGLVADLCEGGFSGVVEILLRNADAHIVIARGSVVAAIESRNAEGDNTNPIARTYARMTVADLAAKSRARTRSRFHLQLLYGNCECNRRFDQCRAALHTIEHGIRRP